MGDQQVYDLLCTRLKSIEKNSAKEVRDSERVTLCFKGFFVNCPRLPLIKESKFFEAVFTNKNFSDSNEDTFVLRSEEFSVFSFAKVLEFIFDKYDSRSNNIQDYRRRKLEMDLKLDNFQSVVELASYLQVKDMDTACTQFIVDKLELENVVDVFEMAIRLDMDKLLRACKLFVGYHFINLLPELCLSNTSFEFVQMVLSLSEIKISQESMMLKFLWDWVKNKLDSRKAFLSSLLPLVRTQQIPDTFLEKYMKKIRKKCGELFVSSLMPTPTLLADKREWPQILVICDSLETDLQELTFTEMNEVLRSMFMARDLENSPWRSLDPPKLKMEAVKKIVFAGGEDTIFLIVRKQFEFIEENGEYVVSIWVNDLRGKDPVWSKLPYRLPGEIHQMTDLTAKFCWSILFLAGSISGSNYGFYIDLDAYEPEWRQWSPPARHPVSDMCGGASSVLWVVTKHGGCDLVESDQVFPSGGKVTIRHVSGPEDIANPRISPYQDSVMVVGGQDPNTKKCLVYDLATRQWVEWGQMIEGRSEPGLATVGSQVYAVGGRGFYWHERVDSVEMMDWEKGEGWRKEDSAGLNLKGSPKVLVVNKPVSWMLEKELLCSSSGLE